MDVVGDLHMNGGETKTSYADNSIVQKVVIDRVSHLLEETAKKLYFKFGGDFGSCIRLADLGCSSGPNTLSVVSKIIITIHGLSLAIDRPEPEIQNFLNDLPCNDFNTIFKSIPAFHNELKS
ncbi:SAM dependent carboxyl methyltransferase [Dillenia turbinata]|uniref:SAM dependent carboxyl methyltransferase n=1 Tax=Dillenia turbinata TaxID=194707 RepID=A0AAN8V6J4_9MAGN